MFVSVDGLRATHDALRGASFDRIMGNIRDSPHPSLFINYTINSRNKDEIRAFCDTSRACDNIRGVFFYLHTPYYGHDALELDSAERQRVLNELLSLRESYRILNSAGGTAIGAEERLGAAADAVPSTRRASSMSAAGTRAIPSCAGSAAT